MGECVRARVSELVSGLRSVKIELDTVLRCHAHGCDVFSMIYFRLKFRCMHKLIYAIPTKDRTLAMHGALPVV